MTECRTPELQDLLPDYVASSLSDADRVRVMAHVAECTACAADLELLRLVGAARPTIAPLDTARIVAALPTAPSARPILALHTVPPSVTRPSRRRPVFGPSIWRLAAVLGVVVTGGLSVLVARRGVSTTEAGVAGATSKAPAVAVAPIAGVAETSVTTSMPETTVAVAVPSAERVATRADVSVSYGGLDDVTDDELQRLLDRLEQWDGATNTEPLPSLSPVQVTPRGGALP
jgi:anti-sigma factor RsiW